jgi:hypothetical protein
MSPALISAFIQLGPAAVQLAQGVKQTREGKEMQKNLGARVNYEIPEEAKQALALMQNLARPQEMPGQASMQAMMDLQAQKAYGNASRAATSSQDLLGVATNLGEQAQENQLKLGIDAARDYERRQQGLYGALGAMAGYQEKKTADSQQDWYERAQAAAAMRGAGIENTFGAFKGLASAATSFLSTPDAQKLFTKKAPPAVNAVKFTQDVEDLSGVIENPVGYVPPTMTSDQMLDVTGLRSTNNLDPKSVSDQLRQQMFMNQKSAAMSKFRLEGAPSWTDQPFDPSDPRNVSFTQSVERPFSGDYENPVTYVPPMQSLPANLFPSPMATPPTMETPGYWSIYDKLMRYGKRNGVVPNDGQAMMNGLMMINNGLNP